MSRSLRTSRSFVLGCLFIVACTELSVEAVDVARVVVQPEDAALRVGDSMVLVAEPQDRDGNALGGRPVAWSSSNASVAEVDGSGRVTGIASGTATIRAEVAGRSGDAEVVVRELSVGHIEIQPRTPIVLIGSTVQLSVEVRDELGNPVSVPVQWSSSDPAILTVSGGLVSGHALGSAWVRATAGGFSDSTRTSVLELPVGSVTISPAAASLSVGDTVRFAATVVGSDGLPRPGATVTWRTSNATIVQIDGAGLATAVGTGQAAITATSGGQSATADVRVDRRPPASVEVTPAVAGVQVGGTVQLVATARDAQGAILTDRTAVWASANTQVASVDAAGRVTGLAPGSTQITATVDGVSGGAFVAVTAVQVASVDVAPQSAQLLTGDTVRLTATARDAGGTVVSGRAVTWSTSDATIAQVDGAGLVTAVSTGTTTISATVDGRVGTAAITVTAVPVASVAVTPATATLQIGATAQLTATTRAADGSTLTGRVIAWSTSDAGVATVDASGLVTGVKAGTATITANSEGKTATASITVLPPPVASVQVSPASDSVVAGAQLQLTATTKAADGTVLTGRSITWNTSDAAIATVNGSGLVTGVTPGTVTITATSEGKNGTASIRVTPRPVASVQVSPASDSVVSGAQLQLTATTKAADGTVLTGRSITWSTSDAAIATVNGSGLVTGVATGTVTITATSEGKKGTASIRVTPPPVASVQVSPATASVETGTQVQLTATTRAADGTVLTGRAIAWTSSDPAVATVDANGLVTGLTTGTVTVTATSEGQAGTATITVAASPVTPAQVDVQPSFAIVRVGDPLTLQAIVRASDGTVLTGYSVTWSSSDSSIASVNGQGRVNLKKSGSVTITATVGSISGSATIWILP